MTPIPIGFVMLTIPNCISLLRFPLAMLFVYENTILRAITIILVGFSDFADGYIARRYKQSSRVGTVLDPITDKFFVALALTVFYYEGHITAYEIIAMLCRDCSVILFGIYLILTNNFGKYHFRAIWCGKITTTLLLATLRALTFRVPIRSYLYGSFVILGFAALIELYLSDHTFIPPELRKEKSSH
jgi:CDP-diacylglycerol--glycerol-3-phosphate 3-phosphatidyltransferase